MRPAPQLSLDRVQHPEGSGLSRTCPGDIAKVNQLRHNGSSTVPEIHLTRYMPQLMLCKQRYFYPEKTGVDLPETSAFLEIRQLRALFAKRLAAPALFAYAQALLNQPVIAPAAPSENAPALYDEKILARPAEQWLMQSAVEC